MSLCSVELHFFRQESPSKTSSKTPSKTPLIGFKLMVAHIVHAFIMNSLVSTIGVSSTSSSGLDVSLEPVAVVLHLFIASCSRNTNNGFLGTLTATRWTHDDDCTTHSSNKQQVDLHPSGHQQLKVVVATCSKPCHHYQHEQISHYLQCPCIILPRHEFKPTCHFNKPVCRQLHCRIAPFSH